MISEAQSLSVLKYIMNYILYGFTAQEIKVLTQPSSLVDMLGSKSSLYAVINDLDGKTAKVKMEDFEREELAREHLKVEMVSQYENCKVIPYGIRLLGMAHPKTAIYMFFDPGVYLIILR